VVNPTTIDTDHLHIPKISKNKRGGSESIPIIGWTGSHSTMSYLKIIEPAIQSLQKKHAFTFRVISNHPPNLDVQNLEFVPWNKTTEIEDLSMIDIGLMPLEDNIWAQGKCGFKCLQYMALGIPSVVSPVGVNNKIIEHGETGLFCKSDKDWVQNIEKLLENKMLRKSIGEKGRKRIEEFYSVNSNKHVFLKLFT
jgi:glycosyltransferase involved in cell wall biosynthesis